MLKNMTILPKCVVALSSKFNRVSAESVRHTKNNQGNKLIGLRMFVEVALLDCITAIRLYEDMAQEHRKRHESMTKK